MDKLKSLLILFFSALFLFFSANCSAQQNTADIAFADKQIANAKKNSLIDSILTKQQLNDALNIAAKLKNDTLFAKIYEVFGITNARRGNHETALAFFNKQLASGKKAGYDFFIATALNNIANAQSSLGKNNESIETSLKALKIFEQLKNLSFQAKVLLNTGITNMYVGNYEKAIEYELKALAINETINEKSNIASNAAALGALYARTKNFQNALAYNHKALVLFQEMKDELLVSNTMFNIATIEVRQKQYQSAEKHLLELLPYFEKINKKESLRKIYVQLINVADETGKEVEAGNYLRKALQYSVKTGNPVNDIDVLFNEGRLLILEKKYDLAEQKLINALKLANEASLHLQKLNAKKHLIMLYQESGQKSKAARAFMAYDLTKDSLLNQDNINNLNDLQTKYETAKKQDQIIVLNKENNIKSLQLKNNELELVEKTYLINEQNQALIIGDLKLKNTAQKLRNQQLNVDKKDKDIKLLNNKYKIQQLEISNRNFLLAIILLIVAAGSVIGYISYYKYKGQQVAILQQEIYKQQEIATKSVFEGEQNERIRIARDLHDGVGQMLALVKMGLSALNKEAVPEKTINLVDKTIDEVRNVSHNLMPEELNFGIFSALEDLTEKVNASGDTKMKIDINEEIRNLKFAKQNELSIYRIVQEVVNNIIKYAQATVIALSVKQIGNSIHIMIKDDGHGIESGTIDNTKGIGWKNIKARVLFLNGKINVQSERLSGTQIEITLPKDGE